MDIDHQDHAFGDSRIYWLSARLGYMITHQFDREFCILKKNLQSTTKFNDRSFHFKLS